VHRPGTPVSSWLEGKTVQTGRVAAEQQSADTRAARELEQAGYELLHEPREEPWGQTVARLQSPEGAIVGISYAPVLHDED
jgi:hypothetical protein